MSWIKSYPCQDGYICDITKFEMNGEYSFVDATENVAIPFYPADVQKSQAYRRKNSAFCVVKNDMMRNLTAGRRCEFAH